MVLIFSLFFFFFSSRRRHTRFDCDWSSDVCSSDLSYDDPIHAPLGMRAARLYGKVAPNAGHALHMTSHIFVALGLWDDVIAANEQAMRVVNQQRASHGQPPKACGHYVTWLHYAYLQERRFDD